MEEHCYAYLSKYSKDGRVFCLLKMKHNKLNSRKDSVKVEQSSHREPTPQPWNVGVKMKSMNKKSATEVGHDEKMKQKPIRLIQSMPSGRKEDKTQSKQKIKTTQAYPGVGVPSSKVEAVLVPLVKVLCEGMTSERVTLVLLVLWLFE